MIVKFLIRKSAETGSFTVNRYLLDGEDSWCEVDEIFQDIENHEVLSESNFVIKAMEVMKQSRTVSVNLTNEEAKPYINKIFTRNGTPVRFETSLKTLQIN